MTDPKKVAEVTNKIITALRDEDGMDVGIILSALQHATVSIVHSISPTSTEFDDILSKVQGSLAAMGADVSATMDDDK